MRRLFLLVGAVVLVDQMFFAAVAPLLPVYTEEFGLSKVGAGILTASYAAGIFGGTLPAAWLSARLGVKPTLIVGVTLLGAASLPFAFANSVMLLDAARFIQGVGGAFMWVGAMAWIAMAAPPERRGQWLGAMLSAVVTGVLLGPVLGGAATVVGPEIVFGLMAPVALALVICAWATPGIPPAVDAEARTLGWALRRPAVRTGLWLLLIPAIFAGVVAVLAPLRLDELGATGVTIGVVFLIAGAVEATTSPLAGRLSDRRGRFVPIRLGLAGGALVAVLLPLPRTPLLVGLTVALAFLAVACMVAPTLALISEVSESLGLEQVIAFSVTNVGWSSGQLLGGAAGGSLAHAASDFLPYGLMAALCAGALTRLTVSAPTVGEGVAAAPCSRA